MEKQGTWMTGSRTETVGLAAADLSSRPCGRRHTGIPALGSDLKPEMLTGTVEIFVEADVPGRVRRPHGEERHHSAPACSPSACERCELADETCRASPPRVLGGGIVFS